MGQEAEITQRIYELISKAGLSSLKRVSKGRTVTTKYFRDTVKGWFGREIPWPLVEPDLILVFEDMKKVVDDVMIVAIEIKYFEEAKDLDKKLRQSFRELGQPLRNLIFGVDSVVLWHLFSPNVEEPKISNYTDVIEEVKTRLKLPLVYIATTTPNQVFKVYKPSRATMHDIQSLIYWLTNLCATCRNPAMDTEVKIRRSGLKMALGIPI